MRSSRMRTARSLPYGGLCPGGLPDRDPWTETPMDRDPQLNRGPPIQRPPGQRPPTGKRPPGQRPPGHVTCDACWDRDPREQNDTQV